MGYDVSIWCPRHDLSDREAVATWQSLIQGEVPQFLTGSPSVAAFADELTEVASENARAGTSPWTARIAPSDSSVTLSCRWSRSEEVGPALVELAMAHELGLYDPQMELFYRPLYLTETSNCTLKSRVLLSVIPAYGAIIPGILEALPDREDPYLTVTREDRDYARVDWTEYGFRLEYREGADEHLELIERIPAQVATRLLQDFIAGRRWPDDLRFEAARS